MWMTNYIGEIQRQLIVKYRFKENPEKPGIPLDVPDGKYPMTIEGKLDRVRIKNGRIECCNFKKKSSRNSKKKRRNRSPGSLRK